MTLSVRRRAPACRRSTRSAGSSRPSRHLAEALDRVGAGLAIGAGEALALAVGQLALELLALLGEPQPALAAVARPLFCST